MIKKCVGCDSLLWHLGGDPDWKGKDHSQGKPGTVITDDDETHEVPACLDCANDYHTHQRIQEEHGLN